MLGTSHPGVQLVASSQGAEIEDAVLSASTAADLLHLLH